MELHESNDIKANVMVDQINNLKEPYRTVIEMREIKKMSYDEISKKLGKNLSTIKSQIRNGRSILIKDTKDKFKKIDEVYEGRKWRNCIDTIR
jgi:RNA polymerase sigma factor (sigma-70 family)